MPSKNAGKACPDFLIRFDSKVKQVTHSQHELSLAMQEQSIFLRKKAYYMLDRAKSVEEIYSETKGNNKGLYSKELNAEGSGLIKTQQRKYRSDSIRLKACCVLSKNASIIQEREN